jgi:hypothetical protein
MFESANLKIERANQHIADLRTVCSIFVAKPHNLGFYNEAKEMVVEVRLRSPIPSTFSLLIGDTIQNLRTALDHATWKLIGLDGGQQNRRLSFPARRLKLHYEAACNGIQTPRSDTKNFFVAFEAYPGGAGEKLFGLNLLNNVDKHQFLTPIAGVATLQNAKVINPDGQVMLTLENCKFSMGPNGRARLMKLGPDLTFEFDEKSDPTIDIFFGDVELFEFAPLIPTLMHLSEAVSDALRQFNKFVAERS